MEKLPKDETIKNWFGKDKKFKTKSSLEKEMRRRLEIVEKEYKAKKSKLQYILRRLKQI